jgi:hypothetical protein
MHYQTKTIPSLEAIGRVYAGQAYCGHKIAFNKEITH